jgi:hypothetical protein
MIKDVEAIGGAYDELITFEMPVIWPVVARELMGKGYSWAQYSAIESLHKAVNSR